MHLYWKRSTSGHFSPIMHDYNIYNIFSAHFQDIGEYFPAENQVLRTELVQVTSTKDAKTLPYFSKRSLVVEGRAANLVNSQFTLNKNNCLSLFRTDSYLEIKILYKSFKSSVKLCSIEILTVN